MLIVMVVFVVRTIDVYKGQTLSPLLAVVIAVLIALVIILLIESQTGFFETAGKEISDIVNRILHP